MLKVSVIMSTYNDAEYLTESVQSVLNQTYKHIEYIIIDDCSTDGTAAMIGSMYDDRIRYIRNEKNKGLISNLNAGIALATGEYIARIDSDDYWGDTEKLQKQISFLESHGGYALVGTQARVLGVSGKELFSIGTPTADEHIRKTMLIKNPFVHSSVMFRKELALACGGYDETEMYVEDYGLWMRIGKLGKLSNLASSYIYYRENQNGITQQHNLKQVRASIVLIRAHKKSYPGYGFGMLKWRTKELLLLLGFQGIINRYKHIFS